MIEELLKDREKRAHDSAGNPVEQTKRLSTGIDTIIDTFKVLVENPRAGDIEKELYEYHIAQLVNTQEVLKRLSAEQFRQRNALQLYLDNRLDRNSASRISRTWNEEKFD